VVAPLLIGYWSADLPPSALPKQQEEWTQRHKEWLTEWSERASVWPNPRSLVDSDWAWEERESVALHLEVGTCVNQYRGISPCRFCARHNGTAELTDGAFCWPEGLAHYVREHDVRLPQFFVSHVRSSPERLRVAPRPNFDKLGQRDRSWPGAEFAHLLWRPSGNVDESDGLPYFEPDPTWWLQQKVKTVDGSL
jgi:hypothetical protein